MFWVWQAKTHISRNIGENIGNIRNCLSQTRNFQRKSNNIQHFCLKTYVLAILFRSQVTIFVDSFPDVEIWRRMSHHIAITLLDGHLFLRFAWKGELSGDHCAPNETKQEERRHDIWKMRQKFINILQFNSKLNET